ncbi:UNVERIFIED_CONTAM: hypothetical protein Scaly_1616800 [Sesamum calycinum]|uniref:CCHC-type domain-containing protein n=1 Tax=Sesamum calycinum TaxID=2727403 RepID=A0AAW2PC21_9LAMI
MISRIAKPTVQANNFEIKLSIIQIIWSSVQFFGLTEEDLNKHLSNFFEICDTFKFNGVSDDAVRLGVFPFSFDRESLYNVWERFRSILRRCPHYELLVCGRYKLFIMVSIWLIELLLMQLPVRGLKRVADIHSVDAITTFSAQMAALTQKVNNLGAAIWNGAPIGPCGACGQMGHLSQDCLPLPHRLPPLHGLLPRVTVGPPPPPFTTNALTAISLTTTALSHSSIARHCALPCSSPSLATVPATGRVIAVVPVGPLLPYSTGLARSVCSADGVQWSLSPAAPPQQNRSASRTPTPSGTFSILFYVFLEL